MSRFQVDECSELYYDPAPLLEAQRQEDEPTGSAPQPDFQDMAPTAHRGHHPNIGYPYGATSSPTMQRNYIGGPFNAVVPNQFYTGQMESPVRMGMNHDAIGMGAGVSPGMGRRMGRGTMEEY
jgi:hypothetical protein